MGRRRRSTVVVLLGVVLGIGLLGWMWGEEPPPSGSSRENLRPATASGSAISRRPQPSAPSAPPAVDAEQVAVSDLSTPPAVVPPEVVVHVRLVHGDGSPDLDARMRPGCEARVISRGEGEVVFAMPPGSCLIEGIRRDGLLAARADAIEVQGEAGDEIDVELVFPSERTGGIGIGIEETDEGVLVTYVHPGSPADEAGLQAGDVILEVDGLSATTLDLPEFVSVMTGPEGTPIAFVLAGESDTGTFEEELELTRSFLPARES